MLEIVVGTCKQNLFVMMVMKAILIMIIMMEEMDLRLDHIVFEAWLDHIVFEAYLPLKFSH